MTATPTPGDLSVRLPELPEPQRECWIGHTLYTADQMRAYAIAALSALPAAGGEVAAWQYRFIDPEEGPGGWLTIDEQHVALMRGKKSCEVRALGALTTPQPSAAEVPSSLGNWHEPAIAAVGAQGDGDD